MADEKEERGEIERLMNLDQPVIYIRHVFYIRFDELVHEHPIYINIVRDPVDMFVSMYYYRRFGHNGEKALPGKWSTNMPDDERNMTIGECIEQNAKECAQPERYLIPFFCGSTKACRSQPPSNEALEMAKRRLRDEYAFVGLTEDFPNTMRALEKLVPSFFDGAAKVYQAQGAQLHEKSKTHDRKGKTALSSRF